MGCSYLNHLQKGGNANYESQRTLQEMLHIIAEQIAAPILQDICKSRYYSILIDVTTDIAVIKQMTILARYITENNQLPTEHLIGLGSDGASFMVGRKSGSSDCYTRMPPCTNIASLEREASERSDATAAGHGLAMFVKTTKFVASIHMMSDPLQDSKNKFQGYIPALPRKCCPDDSRTYMTDFQTTQYWMHYMSVMDPDLLNAEDPTLIEWVQHIKLKVWYRDNDEVSEVQSKCCGKGTRQRIPAIGSYSNFSLKKEAYLYGKLMALEKEPDDNTFHQLPKRNTKSDTENLVIQCTNDGCTEEFSTERELLNHQFVGKCQIEIEFNSGLNSDITKKKYYEKLGWALKTERKSKRFN
ncbi:unnamed protein product [Mytilus edulis]|uniref:DUF4371 domain-containing protein n=1 Tax=Mytilus edulis TaxID=6550 RepID=A0A8S3UIX0_MYTED|nr:unnamed protein product [Mytilus edulis]